MRDRTLGPLERSDVELVLELERHRVGAGCDHPEAPPRRDL
jgi:hypothetical protein